jgi:hypothetical protein
VNREELEHVLRAAADVLKEPHFIVIGSQAVLGSFTEEELPNQALRSIEVDVVVPDDPDEMKMRMIDRNIGEDSEFHRTNGMYAEGVSLSTAVLPLGWRRRLVRFQTRTLYPVQGLCLEPHDCVVSKMVADRRKDHEFANAMIAARLVNPDTLRERIELLPVSRHDKDRLQQWLRGRIAQLPG